jgi:hypothetical protein
MAAHRNHRARVKKKRKEKSWHEHKKALGVVIF